ncbi:hypothetical protein C8F01DRAFT_1150624 [Mycena amicta]|nr:hypothetical protein C8F01DRAFT_1150624 [Mycena amicta]
MVSALRRSGSSYLTITSLAIRLRCAYRPIPIQSDALPEYLMDEALQEILAFFPALLKLDMQIDCPLDAKDHSDFSNPIPRNFFSMLPRIATMPQSLLVLSIRLSFSYNAARGLKFRHDTSESDLASVQEALVGCCPNLSYLWLDGDLFLYHWRRAGSCTYNFFGDGDAYILRQDFDSFCEIPDSQH